MGGCMGTSHEPSVHVSSSDQFGNPGGLWSIISVASDVVLRVVLLKRHMFQLLLVGISHWRKKSHRGLRKFRLQEASFAAKGTSFGKQRRRSRGEKRSGTLWEQQLRQKTTSWHKRLSMEPTLHFLQVRYTKRNAFEISQNSAARDFLCVRQALYWSVEGSKTDSCANRLTYLLYIWIERTQFTESNITRTPKDVHRPNINLLSPLETYFTDLSTGAICIYYHVVKMNVFHRIDMVLFKYYL